MFQAILPLRGKILNVEKAMDQQGFSKVRKSVICFKALGVTIGTEEDSKEANIEKLRYHKIVYDRCRCGRGAHCHVVADILSGSARPLLEQDMFIWRRPLCTNVRVSGVKPRNIAGPINKRISSV